MHMCDGTRQVVKYLESVGAKFGACQNAYTSFDETCYEQVDILKSPLATKSAIQNHYNADF